MLELRRTIKEGTAADLYIGGKVCKAMECNDVDKHDDAEADQPRLVQLLSWAVRGDQVIDPKHEAESNSAHYESQWVVAAAKHLLAALRHILVPLDLVEESLLFKLGQLLASCARCLRANKAVILIVFVAAVFYAFFVYLELVSADLHLYFGVRLALSTVLGRLCRLGATSKEVGKHLCV